MTSGVRIPQLSEIITFYFDVFLFNMTYIIWR